MVKAEMRVHGSCATCGAGRCRVVRGCAVCCEMMVDGTEWWHVVACYGLATVRHVVKCCCPVLVYTVQLLGLVRFVTICRGLFLVDAMYFRVMNGVCRDGGARWRAFCGVVSDGASRHQTVRGGLEWCGFVDNGYLRSGSWFVIVHGVWMCRIQPT